MSEAALRSHAGRIVAAAGAAHAVLFLLAFALVSSTPEAHAPDEVLVAFYQSGNGTRLVLVGLYVMPFAGIAFLWFTAALRAWIRPDSAGTSAIVSGIQLASGLLYVALFFAGAASSSVTAVSLEFSRVPVDPLVARLFPIYGGTLLLVFAMRMAAMFMFTTSRLGRAVGLLPRWFAHVSFVASLFLMFSATLSRVLILVFPLWLFLLCALIVLRTGVRADPHAASDARATP